MKLTFEDKKEICRLYKEEFLSYSKISKMFKVGETTVKRIINRCKEHGKESLRHPAKQRIFSADFKMMIINKVYEGEAKEQTDMENDILKKLDALIQKRQKKEEK